MLYELNDPTDPSIVAAPEHLVVSSPRSKRLHYFVCTAQGLERHRPIALVCRTLGVDRWSMSSIVLIRKS